MKIKIDKLKELCECSELQLWVNLVDKEEWDVDSGLYLYKDNGSEILAVAHMDVFRDDPLYSFKHFRTGGDNICLCPSLDDRLGVFIITQLLPKMGINVDVLLTSDEECCNSSAEHFTPTKNYKWIVEFDRAGSDVVMYQYEDVPDLRKDLESVGFKIGIGSYSDICVMDELEVGAFNVGIGYHFQHSSQCCVSINEMWFQLQKFQKFYNQFKSKNYIYKESESKHGLWGWRSRWDEEWCNQEAWQRSWYGDDDEQWWKKYGVQGGHGKKKSSISDNRRFLRSGLY